MSPFFGKVVSLAIGDGDATREPSGPASWPLSKRDLAGEGHFEYGSRCGYWRLLDIFDEQQVKCTFYACAVALERNRDAAREMRKRGHEVMSHGYRWEDVTLLTREQEREIIKRTTSAYAADVDPVITGEEVIAIQQTVRKVPVPDHVTDFVLDLVRRARPGDPA